MLTKNEYARGLMVLMDLTEDDVPELMKVKIDVLQRMFEGIKTNALAYQDMASGK